MCYTSKFPPHQYPSPLSRKLQVSGILTDLHVGPEGLRHFYDPALDSAGVVLHHCTATFDGRTFAVEYICDEWANVKLPPQAGLAVYELAGPDKLQAARIYDDVTPPFE